jgi:ribosomal protein L7/L12
MKPAKCENCGAAVIAGADRCGFCGVTFVARAPGAPTGADPELISLLRAGKKIEAIKAYHQARRCGLKEAKDAVDALEREISGGR